MKKMKKNYFNFLLLIVVITSAVFLQSCGGDDGVNPVGNNMDFAFKAKDSTINYTGTDVIIIDSAKMLIKNVSLQGQFGGVNDLTTGTTLVVMNPVNGFSNYIGGLLPNSQYVSINYFLKSRTADDGITDPDFPVGTSFVIKGRFNGVPFVYQSGAIDQNYGLLFPSNLRVISATTHVTITYNPKLWFRVAADESIIVNPNALTPALRTYIDDSFRGSLAVTLSSAFKDDNKDGIEDTN